MKNKNSFTRRTALKTLGASGTAAFLASQSDSAETISAPSKPAKPQGDIRSRIFQKVLDTPFIDTHEHLIEEEERIEASHPRIKSDDWSFIFCHYINHDMVTAGMPRDAYNKFFSPKVDPVAKWDLLEPYWPAVKNSGYGQAVWIAIKELYGVDELSKKTINQVQAGYEKTRRKGFYKYILCEKAKIESCQVNSVSRPFFESNMPTLLMQDLKIVEMFAGPNFKLYGEPAGIKVNSLSDWYKVIDWWFKKYGKYAVAAKSQNAYSRDIDYKKVTAKRAEPIFKKKLAKEKITPSEKKALEDHLFWYAVGKATEYNLPVKIHTGYYAGQDYMPLARLANNPGSATDLCRNSKETRFVFMHICYPYYEEMIAIAKHYTNAYIDMCWSWIMNPVAAKDFLKKYLVSAPANKILTFGGDYVSVEPVLGHAIITRRGISLALSELVEEGWLSLKDALELIDPIMHGNARKIFALEKKNKLLKNIKWS
ncbi:MAG: amidohydrolase family protein [Planctomycetota bacterium]|jgi:predicted TIM-barrel fold metal-dependent hydrolase